MKFKYAIVAILFVVSMPSLALAQSSDIEDQARKIVEEYLVKNEMPVEQLQSYNSKTSPKPDYTFLYKGGGRCIEFIINCWGNRCGQLGKYPYDEHGEKCPITNQSMSPSAGQA
ncbi:hypothetical protein [Microbulbifer sp. PAAF003]|uniref:hypothetical protein n=1 Tax=Microbulbifer sp. PAAF003 TaxID=3243375 RepID=UPI00403A64CE